MVGEVGEEGVVVVMVLEVVFEEAIVEVVVV